ncbi:hypothetical protein GGR51DRAFT_509456 [Nemania sp. FL0031]|nr:hypothetical protein GGR51DRAFT_509456 [Nemania sp. FL0031]
MGYAQGNPIMSPGPQLYAIACRLSCYLEIYIPWYRYAYLGYLLLDGMLGIYIRTRHSTALTHKSHWVSICYVECRLVPFGYLCHIVVFIGDRTRSMVP